MPLPRHMDISRDHRRSPACARIREYDNFGRPKIFSAVQLSMALHEVACMTIKMNDSESSILHTLEFLRLEQHHPVSGMYQFGIPKITSSCICDCAGGDTPCKMNEYNYRYNIYDRFNNRWRKASEEVVEVPMNRGIFKFDFNNVQKIEMVVSGSRPNREVQPGMYFFREGTHELRGFVPINDIGESSLEKLGWMRYADGKWDIRNGLVKIKQAHVHMTSETRPHMLRHISQLESFEGMIQVDRDSNRYLNISFLGSKGTLIGNIFSSKKDQIDMAFSVQVDSKVHHYRSIISIPSSINSSRYVCFHPSGDIKGEICKWFKYETQRLNSYRVAHRWQRGQGDCGGCNERGVESFLTSLDPRQWFNGISTPVEAFTMAVEMVIVICLVLLFFAICTKCLIPLVRCTFSVSKTPKK
ncbi:hypothetical protein OSTOST_19542 [Ostertagia ostertagi]